MYTNCYNSLIKPGLLHVRVEVLHLYFATTIPPSAVHLENFHPLNTHTGLSLEGIFSCVFLSSTDLHIKKNTCHNLYLPEWIPSFLEPSIICKEPLITSLFLFISFLLCIHCVNHSILIDRLNSQFGVTRFVSASTTFVVSGNISRECSPHFSLKLLQYSSLRSSAYSSCLSTTCTAQCSQAHLQYIQVLANNISSLSTPLAAG